MGRLIDADALAELLKREAEHHEADGLLERSYGVLDAYMDVLDAPTVHPEPPKRMAHMINRQDAISALGILADKMDESGASVMRQAIEVLRAIEAYPEPPKRGKWVRYYIRPNVFKDLYWHCSECGHRETYSYADRYYKFCPCCGAYMGGKNGND